MHLVISCRSQKPHECRSQDKECCYQCEYEQDLPNLDTDVEKQQRGRQFRLRQADEFLPGYWGEAGAHLPSSIMLAATYLYDGQRDTGLDLAARTMRALVIEQRAS